MSSTVAEITTEKVSKVYPDGTQAVTEVDLEVADGRFVVLVGPSGCGKTTLLRMVAGLEDITEGIVRIGGRVVNDLAPKDRDVAMVFQNYALYPHMSVYENLAFSLKVRHERKTEIDSRVREAARMLGLGELLRKKPKQLSGGQRQRVAMGRAMVRRPQAFLMDEPLSNLDAKLRTQVRGDLKRLHREVEVTSIYVTHDQVEAMTLGDRICAMSAGEVQQIGTTDEIYHRPANTFVAGFMGSPPMNLVPGEIRGGAVRVAGAALTDVPSSDRPVTVGFRPEDLHLGGAATETSVPAR